MAIKMKDKLYSHNCGQHLLFIHKLFIVNLFQHNIQPENKDRNMDIYKTFHINHENF